MRLLGEKRMASWRLVALLALVGALVAPTGRAQEEVAPPAPGVGRLDLVARLGGPVASVALQGPHRAYIGVGYRLVVVDRTDPTHPVELAQSTTLPGQVQSIAVDGAYAYVGFGAIDQAETSGLRIFDISDGRQPVELATLQGPAFDLAVVRHYEHLAVASGEQGLRIVDVSDPAMPRVVSIFNPPGRVDRVTVAGGLAYTTGSSDQGSSGGVLRIVRLADPERPADPLTRSSWDATRTPSALRWASPCRGGSCTLRCRTPASARHRLAPYGCWMWLTRASRPSCGPSTYLRLSRRVG